MVPSLTVSDNEGGTRYEVLCVADLKAESLVPEQLSLWGRGSHFVFSTSVMV